LRFVFLNDEFSFLRSVIEVWMKNKTMDILLGILLVILSSCTVIPATGTMTETPVATAFIPETIQSVSTPAYTNIPSATSTPIPTPALGNVTSFPDPSLYTWTSVVTGLNKPIGIANAGDGSGILYIIEKAGVIRMIHNGQLLPDPFLDIHDRVGSRSSEQGLLGLAFHPKYSENGFFYVNYTDLNGNTVIARFSESISAMPGNPGADASSEVIVLRVDQPFANHNGGQLAFGPDGMLYLGLGDGGSGGDPNGNGQSVKTLLAKILRIDIDHGNPYGTPAGNPFASGGGMPEIWAIGLRNPWRFSFDSKTGDLYIGDVGQDLWEEIDYLPAGFSAVPANFGWSIREGLHPFKNTPNETGTPLIDPIYEYGHDLGCAVIGGYVYRGSALPDFNGVYLFGDNCSGTIWSLIPTGNGSFQGQVLFQTGLNISSFGVDENGEIYLADLGGGIYKLEKK
jgi:glucose/arabinose dehydrogenase